MLVLVRHGRSIANVAQQLSGRAETSLTDEGRAEVAALAPMLGPVSMLVTSPLRRAVESARILAPTMQPVVDARWIEIDYGQLEGRPLSEVPADLWRRWKSDVAFRPPEGESLADVGARVRDACEEYFHDADAPARRDESNLVVVSHVSPIKAAVAWALGGGDDLAWRLHLSTGSLSAIGWAGEGPVLYRYNARARSSAA
ncbi:MAG: histidine phosphatase family protein [Acidimicrobiales bacterium]